MPSKKTNRLIGAALMILVLVFAVITADYFALFGVEESARTAMVEFRVETRDAETGRPINGVKVTCFQYGTNNACGQPASRERGIVRLQLRMKKHLHESLFFTQKVSYSPVLENELRIMYIHPDYQKPVQRFDITELMQRSNRTWSVEMEPLTSSAERSAGDADSQQEESSQ